MAPPPARLASHLAQLRTARLARPALRSRGAAARKPALPPLCARCENARTRTGDGTRAPGKVALLGEGRRYVGRLFRITGPGPGRGRGAAGAEAKGSRVGSQVTLDVFGVIDRHGTTYAGGGEWCAGIHIQMYGGSQGDVVPSRAQRVPCRRFRQVKVLQRVLWNAGEAQAQIPGYYYAEVKEPKELEFGKLRYSPPGLQRSSCGFSAPLLEPAVEKQQLGTGPRLPAGLQQILVRRAP